MRLTVLGHDVACQVAGTGPVDVLLVHGIGVSGRYFAPLARELAGGARVVAPDLVGFGGSPRAGEPLTIAEHAAVVGGLIDELGLARPVVVGHSMGAQVVCELAAARPDAVAAVVLVGAVADPRAPSALRQAARLLRDVAHEPPAWTARQLVEYLRCGPRWYLATLPHMLAFPTAGRLADVTVPVLLVRGVRDPVTPPAFQADLAAAAPTAERLVVGKGGHLAMVNGARAVADAVARLAARSPA